MANELSNLAPVKGARRKPMRVGRGEGSGKGKTCGRGQKGQRARGAPRLGFEGGQMPLTRRLPKRGFKNLFAKKYSVVRLDAIAGRFEAGSTVDAAALQEAGMIGRLAKDGVKVLGNGEVGHALHLKVAAVTRGASDKITAAGGSVELVDDRRDYTEIRLNQIAKAFSAGDTVDNETLKARGVVDSIGSAGVRLHGNGNIGYPLTVRVAKLSRTAAAKIRAAGGRVEVI